MQGVHLWKSLLNLHVAMPNYFLKIIYGFFFQLLYYLLNTWGFLHQQKWTTFSTWKKSWLLMYSYSVCANILLYKNDEPGTEWSSEAKGRNSTENYFLGTK